MIYIALTQNIRPSVGDIWKGFGVFGKGYAYLMAPYILADNLGMTAHEALRESKRMTNGHKGELFVLNLSLIGWMLLIPLTLGLIVIWLAPYTHATLANYYLAMKDNNENNIE